MGKVSRREALRVSAGLPVLLLAAGRTSVAYAQTEELKRALQEGLDSSSGLLNEIRDSNFPLDQNKGRSYWMREDNIRARFQKNLIGAKENDIFNSLPADYIKDIASLYIEQKIPLVPRQGLQPTPPIPSKPSAPVPCRGKAGVVLDVCLEVLDLRGDVAKTIKDAISELNNLSPRFEDLNKAVHSGENDQIVNAISLIIKTIANGQVLDILVKKLSPELAEMLLTKLGLRFVPIVGWVLLAVDVLLAVSNHWEELTCKA